MSFKRIRLAKRLKSFKRLRLVPRFCDFGISSTFDAVLRYLPIFFAVLRNLSIFSAVLRCSAPPKVQIFIISLRLIRRAGKETSQSQAESSTATKIAVPKFQKLNLFGC